MDPNDVLCDFCRRPWGGSRPVVEGHHGSIVCGDCLAAAYTALIMDEAETAPPGSTCTMCLEVREESCWRSPDHADAIICRRCANQSARVLHKNADYEWWRPDRPPEE